jgi:hypothetical protein
VFYGTVSLIPIYKLLTVSKKKYRHTSKMKLNRKISYTKLRNVIPLQQPADRITSFRIHKNNFQNWQLHESKYEGKFKNLKYCIS